MEATFVLEQWLRELPALGKEYDEKLKDTLEYVLGYYFWA